MNMFYNPLQSSFIQNTYQCVFIASLIIFSVQDSLKGASRRQRVGREGLKQSSFNSVTIASTFLLSGPLLTCSSYPLHIRPFLSFIFFSLSVILQ